MIVISRWARPSARRIGTIALACATTVGAATTLGSTGRQSTIYEQLRAAPLAPAGHLQRAHLEVDRANLTFDEGELYLLAPVAGRVTGAVYIGKGTIQLAPPNAIEGDQLDKYLDDPDVDLEFKSLVMRFTDDTGERLRQLAGTPRRPDLKKANSAVSAAA